MPFIPKFMREHAAYQSELSNVKTLPQWELFTKTWFDTSDWPKKSGEDIAKESERKKGPVSLGGRSWCFTNSAYDLTAEARYEYYYATHEVGSPLKFPLWRTSPKKAANGWRQECPYCEISTDEIGSPICPQCSRKLIFEWYSE
jgi:hypothetical protein